MPEDAKQDRLVSLDVFRGMTIAGMVLVNNPGSWDHIYWPLEHAEWNGLTPTDWIFPFFLFIVGVSISISLGKRIHEKPDAKAYIRILSRTAWIYLLGAAISIVPFFQFQATDAPDPIKMIVWLAFTASIYFLLLRNYKVAGILLAVGLVGIAGMNLAGYNVVPYNYGTLRIFGVLQRISVCYLVTSILFLHTTWKQQVGIALVLLLGYWLVITTIPVPGCDVTSVSDKACNLAAYLDRTILGLDHIWRQGKVYDPEGILSTIPAIVTTITGVLTGTWLKSVPPAVAGGLSRAKIDPNSNEVSTLTPSNVEGDVQRPATAGGSDRIVGGLFFFGVTLLAIGLIWNSYFPMNKSLWTSSYVLATTGIALLILGSCYWLIDIKGYKAWAKPFVIFGVNAMALFVFTGFFARMIGAYRVTGVDGKPVAIGAWVYQNIFGSIFQPIDASLAFAICFILLWLFLMWLLYRKKIYIKV
jgi:predicted acyltransferase